MTGRRWLVVLAVLVAVAAIVGGVARSRSGAPGSGACGRPRQDPLDPRSLQHFLPGAPLPVYATEPPTSGPHQPGRLEGVLATPVPGPLQVGALEGGQVLLQHRDLAPADRTALEALAGPLVVVAPNPALSSPVVATAWRTRQLCRSVDVATLSRFIRDHAGRDPDHGG